MKKKPSLDFRNGNFRIDVRRHSPLRLRKRWCLLSGSWEIFTKGLVKVNHLCSIFLDFFFLVLDIFENAFLGNISLVHVDRWLYNFLTHRFGIPLALYFLVERKRKNKSIGKYLLCLLSKHGLLHTCKFSNLSFLERRNIFFSAFSGYWISVYSTNFGIGYERRFFLLSRRRDKLLKVFVVLEFLENYFWMLDAFWKKANFNSLS